ncbi:hypothetical protein, partial [Klebsiella pneumoniae]|uniref:hypothetical protein n=1 Tax=Klebsiella pneumoniae TaxID=573 RepID=UPI001AEF5C3A
LPLLEDQNPVRRSEILAGTGSATLALTEAIKSLSNVSGREAGIDYLLNEWSISIGVATEIKLNPDPHL